MNLMKKVGLVAAAPLAVIGSPAFAQAAGTFDASAYTSNISGLVAGMLAIGGAVFALILAIKSTKWARRAL